MAKNLLLLCYCFPPANVIGAVRPYQIACFFRDNGWNVDVISFDDDSVPNTNDQSIEGLFSLRLKTPKFISWLNSLKIYEGHLGYLKTLFMRVLKYAIRILSFPDHFIGIKNAYINSALHLAKKKDFDLVISSSLPFSVHAAAAEIVKSLSGVIWVADNRDLWCESPYQKMLPFFKLMARNYERKILKKADLILGISQSMVNYYQEQFNFDNVMLVMNGYSFLHQSIEKRGSLAKSKVKIVYGGILYNGVRDPSPLLRAINSNSKLYEMISVSFYGSEQDQVARLVKNFPNCLIDHHSKISSKEISVKYQESSILLVILGNGKFESGVITGKFFEYLLYGKPILAIASKESELGVLIDKYNLGFSGNDPDLISEYLHSFLSENSNRLINAPVELSIDFQLSILYERLKAMPGL